MSNVQIGNEQLISVARIQEASVGVSQWALLEFKLRIYNAM